MSELKKTKKQTKQQNRPHHWHQMISRKLAHGKPPLNRREQTQYFKRQNKNGRKNGPNGRKTTRGRRNMTRSLNKKPISRIYEKLGKERRNIAWIARLRTGQCSLNGYLDSTSSKTQHAIAVPRTKQPNTSLWSARSTRENGINGGGKWEWEG